MDIKNFFEDDQRYQLTLVELAAIDNVGSMLTLPYLQNYLDLSEYKLNTLINDLNDSWYNLFNQQLFIKNGKNFIVHREISINKITKFKSYLAKRSLPFRMFISTLLHKNLKEFSEENYISFSKSYNVQKTLIHILSHYNIYIEKDVFVGDETTIQLLAYQLLFTVYYENEYLFPDEMKQAAVEYYRILESIFNWSLTPLEKTKIELYLILTIIRQSSTGFNYLIALTDSKKMIALTQGWEKISDNSPAHFLLFLFCQGMIDAITIDDEKLLLYLGNEKRRFITLFTNYFQVSVDDFFENPLFNIEFQRIILRQKFFPIVFQSFETIGSSAIMQNLFVSYDHFIRLLLSHYTFFNDELKNNSYYDFMMLLYHFFPIKEFEPTVTICIHFSRGKLYSEFIADLITNFYLLPIKIEYKLSNRTDIYLSDFENKKFIRKQIIWKNPPDSRDWQIFIDTLSKARSEKYKKES
ncbi:hypothetical protein [Enterococcus camelliae]|uniref:Mga helix-turn-helix domain-containing protein n=1 Tax=Enterococcus camelliae TaxID=453959 RepID=A0ABW5THS5_9ENTE